MRHALFYDYCFYHNISRSAIFWSVSPCSSLRASRKDRRVGLVHWYQGFEPQVPTCKLCWMISASQQVAEPCWFQHVPSNLSGLLRVLIYVECRIAAVGDVGLQNFTGAADDISLHYWRVHTALHHIGMQHSDSHRPVALITSGMKVWLAGEVTP